MTLLEAQPDQNQDATLEQLALTESVVHPNLVSDLEIAIGLEGEADDHHLRDALQAENRSESNEALEVYIDSLVGLKVQAIDEGEPLANGEAERIFREAIGGDKQARQKVGGALELIQGHDDDVRSRRKKEHEEFLAEYEMSSESEAPKEVNYGMFSMVHQTNHRPVLDRQSQHRYIDERFTSSQKAKIRIPRSTVHTSLNAAVESSSFSANWDEQLFVVVAPMDKIVELNGEPTSMVAHDTWWEVTPGKGLQLPDDVIVVQPGTDVLVSELSSDRTICYKNQGFEPKDVVDIMQLAEDYEVKQIAESIIGMGLAPDELKEVLHHLRPVGQEIKGHSIPNAVTELPEKAKEIVKSKLSELLQDDPDTAQGLLARLGKLVATRKAIELQGHALLEPLTVMGGQFKAEELSEDLENFALSRAMLGHHAETKIGDLENQAMRIYNENGSIDEEEAKRVRGEVRKSVHELSKATLNMYYRLGLL